MRYVIGIGSNMGDSVSIVRRAIDEIEACITPRTRAICVVHYLGLPVDMDRVNVNGGHLAMGHPMGATGAILITATVAEMRRTGAARGITVAHGGAGVGVAAVLESV